MKVSTITNSPEFETTKYYEPKSVLDLRRSPSPPADRPTHYSDVIDPLHLDEHVLNHLEDWDSLMRELGLHDDFAPTTKSIPQFTSNSDDSSSLIQHLPPSDHFTRSLHFDHFSNDPNLLTANYHHNNDQDDINTNDPIPNHAFDFIDDLIQLADCFETNSPPQLAQAILTRLNQRLPSPTGKPLQRAAFYFKEAMRHILTGSTRSSSTSSEIVQTIEAYKTFSNVSPIPMFANFTANQAILEAVDGSMIVHVIDFDIGLGGQWASFMREIADKAENRKATTNAPLIRITAVVPEEYGKESRLIRETLCQFARELQIGFEIDFVSVTAFEFLSFKAIKFADGEKIAILLSPAIFRRVGAGFVNDLRRVSPHVVVHVDFEGLITTSFRQTVIDGLEFYSTILESLEAANVGCGDWIRKVEKFVLLPKITAAVESVGRRGTPWREVFSGAGIRPVVLSQFADSQADSLLRRVQVRGFHVATRQAEMVLCWHDRALVATSAWRC